METLILFIPPELWSDLRAHQENVYKVSDIGHDYRSEKLRISVPSYGIRWCFSFSCLRPISLLISFSSIRTGRCVQHSDEQRRQVRQLLLRQR